MTSERGRSNEDSEYTEGFADFRKSAGGIEKRNFVGLAGRNASRFECRLFLALTFPERRHERSPRARDTAEYCALVAPFLEKTRIQRTRRLFEKYYSVISPAPLSQATVSKFLNSSRWIFNESRRAYWFLY